MLFLMRENYMDIFNQIRLLQLSVLLIFQFHIISITSCPDLCSPCSQDDLICDKSGLAEIPKQNNKNLKKIIIQNQQFNNPVLSAGNFSFYQKLQEVSIRLSNIIKIQPFTFQMLSDLRNLDFSENTELIIENNAFNRLNLQFLKLDNMGIIKLDNQAFNGLSVDTLSIQTSNLLSLPVELIQSIAHSLTKLLLKGNQLRSLDAKLRPVFINLKTLELQENPFICNCSLLWLSEILDKKKSENKIQVSENAEEMYPKCVAPSELRKQYVFDLVRKLKNCVPPTIVQIDVVFHSYSMVELYCFIKEIDNSSESTEVGWFSPTKSINSARNWQRLIKIPINSSPLKYRCKAQNDLGNSEIDLLLSWNEAEKQGIILENNNNNNNNNNTIKFEEIPAKQNFLWEKVFSLFEMICAIFGTLVITVILFFLFCCCYVERSNLLLINKKKRKLQTKSYPSYERGVYSDTRIYCETDMDVCPFPPPPPPTPPPVPDSRLIPKIIY